MTYPQIKYRRNTYHFGPKGPSDLVRERIDALYAVTGTVPYKISHRFAFYRLWEQRDHYFPDLDPTKDKDAKDKAANRCWKSWSKAVHDGIYPVDTFKDDSSQYQRGNWVGSRDKADWLHWVIDYKMSY